MWKTTFFIVLDISPFVFLTSLKIESHVRSFHNKRSRDLVKVTKPVELMGRLGESNVIHGLSFLGIIIQPTALGIIQPFSIGIVFRQFNNALKINGHSTPSPATCTEIKWN